MYFNFSERRRLDSHSTKFLACPFKLHHLSLKKKRVIFKTNRRSYLYIVRGLFHKLLPAQTSKTLISAIPEKDQTEKQTKATYDTTPFFRSLFSL
jgi:hypothetical protein